MAEKLLDRFESGDDRMPAQCPENSIAQDQKVSEDQGMIGQCLQGKCNVG